MWCKKRPTYNVIYLVLDSLRLNTVDQRTVNKIKNSKHSVKKVILLKILAMKIMFNRIGPMISKELRSWSPQSLFLINRFLCLSTTPFLFFSSWSPPFHPSAKDLHPFLKRGCVSSENILFLKVIQTKRFLRHFLGYVYQKKGRKFEKSQ